MGVAARSDESTTAGDWRPGAAYLFNTNGALLATLAHPNPRRGNYDGFGAAVAAVSNDRVLIGAPNWDIWIPGHGAAYLLSANGNSLATFTSPTPAVGDDFGYSLTAVGSDCVLIGAPGTGTVYLFDTHGALLMTFSNPNAVPANVAQFGLAVAAVGGDRVLVGAPSYDPARAGAAYLFSTNGTLLTTFTNASHPVAAIGDNFGCALTAVDADRVLIGAPWSGVASLFSTDGALLFTFTDPWTNYRQRFGSLLAALGPNRALLGSEYGGPVYLFRAPSQVRWLGGAGNWSDATKWSPSPPTSDDAVVLPAGSVVNVDVGGAQVGALTVAAGSTVNVQSGAALAAYGPLFNNGTMNLSSDVTSYAAGNAVVQNGTLTINDGVAMKGFDGGGNDFAFVQTDGSTMVGGGLLDFANGHIRVQGGSVNVDQTGAMRGMDSGGHDVAYGQTGGTLGGSGTIDGSLLADAGVIAPGDSPGTLTITSNFIQHAGSTLRIQIAGRTAG